MEKLFCYQADAGLPSPPASAILPAMAASTKQAGLFTYDELKTKGREAIAQGKIVQVYVHHPDGGTESTMTGVMDGETPETAAVRLVKDLEGVALDETYVERMPKDEKGILRVKVLVPEKKEAASKQPDVYAVDLDGTLAHHDPDAPFDPEHIGEPVKTMRNLVRQWTRRGIQVVILTARASTQKNIKVVKAWLKEHGMEGLEVTNIKSPSFSRIYDDRAVQVEQNTGRLIKDASALRQGFVIDQPKGSYREFAPPDSDYPLKGVTYPTDYGYLPGYYGEDEAELDFFRGTGNEHGSFRVRRDDVPGGETKFMMDMTPEERQAVLAAFQPVIEGDPETLDELALLERLKDFKLPSKEAGFSPPENFDHIKELSTKDYNISAGANDWENSWSAATMQPVNTTQRVWIELPSDDDQQGKPSDAGKQCVKNWVATAKQTHGRDGQMTWLEAFEHAAKELKKDDLILEHGTEKQVWQEKKASVMATPLTDSTDKLVPLPIDPQWTGPAAIEHALKNLDLAAIEHDANEVLRRKLKSKRPQAVERLGFLDGLKRTGIKPHELMVSRVPVIPPMFRPFSMAGNTFVPGDANELYRDLVNLIGTHKKLEERLGGSFSGENRLRVYDAVRAVYGHGEPVVPKTAERGVSGFLKQITGVSPKFCYDSSTEILTDSGWKYFFEAKPEDKVLTYNADRQIYEWERPVVWTNYEHKDGHLVRIETAEGDLLVTPGHTMWVRQSGQWVRILAAELVYNHSQHSFQLEGSPRLDAGPAEVSRLVELKTARFEPYQDRVYCCSTQNGLIIVRRHSFTTVCGNSYMQRKLVAHDQDFTGRATGTLDPDLSLDEVGIPDEMAWKLYGAYTQRRLVRAGMRPEEALQHITDQSSYASKLLDLEMKERPVMISRAPAWHKFNTLGGWARRTKGSSVALNPLILTGMNGDFDGDSGRFVVRIAKKLDSGSEELAKDSPMLQAKSSVKLLESNIHISNFPRLEETRKELRAGVFEYDVPPGVFAYGLERNTNKHGWLPVTKFSEHLGLQLWRVDLVSGEAIFPSSDHSLVAYRNGSLDLVKPSEAIGLCLPRITSFNLPSGPVESVVAAGRDERANQVREFKLKLNRDIGLFLGLLIGDGCVNVRSQVYLYGSGEKVANREQFSAIVQSSQLPYAGHVAESHFTTASLGGGETERQRSVVSDCSWFNRWLKEQIGEGALEKRIPDFSLNASEDHLQGLLDGLISTDGSVSVSRGKKKPQLMISFSTSSPDLVTGLQVLLQRLQVRSSVTDYISTTSGRPAFIVTISTTSFRHLVDRGFKLTHPGKQAILSDHISSVDLLSATAQCGDQVPYPHHLNEELKQGYRTEHQKKKANGKTDYGSLPASRVRGTMGRGIMLELLSACQRHGIWNEGMAAYQKLVLDRTVGWELVEQSTAFPIPMTGWDITVPGALTFALASGLIVQDTFNVHVVSTPDAVRDVKEKIMPSKMLHSIKERDSIVPVPKHEYLLGIHGAQTLPAQQKHNFPDQASALAAIKAGQVRLTDEIEIGTPALPAR